MVGTVPSEQHQHVPPVEPPVEGPRRAPWSGSPGTAPPAHGPAARHRGRGEDRERVPAFGLGVVHWHHDVARLDVTPARWRSRLLIDRLARLRLQGIAQPRVDGLEDAGHDAFVQDGHERGRSRCRDRSRSRSGCSEAPPEVGRSPYPRRCLVVTTAVLGDEVDLPERHPVEGEDLRRRDAVAEPGDGDVAQQPVLTLEAVEVEDPAGCLTTMSWMMPTRVLLPKRMASIRLAFRGPPSGNVAGER